MLVIAAIAGAFYLGKSTLRQNSSGQATPTSPTPVTTPKPPQPTLASSSSPAPTNPDESANWKTYTNDIFSFQYPNNWYVNKYLGSSNFAYFVQVSDVESSYTSIQGMSDTHTG
ncbi:MAG: hypothetical protein M1142_05890 [Patescibacteria group bacterium]|nr:hypothetical protein [Patescibacteria group bacterium]